LALLLRVDWPAPLEARQIDASGHLVEEAVGQIELEENVLVIRRVRVRLILTTQVCRQPSGLPKFKGGD
jgi:hypothetical protein